MTTIDLPTTRSGSLRSEQPGLDGAAMLAIAHGLADSSTVPRGSTGMVERCWWKVAATDRLEVFVIAWPVGSAIELHDHGISAGAIVVTSGSLVEHSVHSGGDGTLGVASASMTVGDSVIFEPGHVHDIVNGGSELAVSVHVYSPVLTTMTYFDVVDDRRLVSVRTELFGSGEVLP